MKKKHTWIYGEIFRGEKVPFYVIRTDKDSLYKSLVEKGITDICREDLDLKDENGNPYDIILEEYPTKQHRAYLQEVSFFDSF